MVEWVEEKLETGKHDVTTDCAAVGTGEISEADEVRGFGELKVIDSGRFSESSWVIWPPGLTLSELESEYPV